MSVEVYFNLFMSVDNDEGVKYCSLTYIIMSYIFYMVFYPDVRTVK